MAAREPRPDQQFGESEQPVERPVAVPPTPGQDVTGGTREHVGGTADLVGGPAGETSPAGTGTSTGAGTGTDASDAPPLLNPVDTERFRGQWETIQTGFVDEPRNSVQQADQLVAELMRQLAEGFAQQRSTLEADWDRGEEVSTEDLRLTLQRYRSFFQRLLAA